MIQALLTYVDRLLNLGLDVSELDEAVKAFQVRCDQMLARDPSAQTHVRQLEQQYDATVDKGRSALREEALNSEQLMQELEDFLREQREGGGET